MGWFYDFSVFFCLPFLLFSVFLLAEFRLCALAPLRPACLPAFSRQPFYVPEMLVITCEVQRSSGGCRQLSAPSSLGHTSALLSSSRNGWCPGFSSFFVFGHEPRHVCELMSCVRAYPSVPAENNLFFTLKVNRF